MNSITALNQNSVFPGFDEVIIEQDLPLCVHELAVTKGHERVTRSTFAS